MLGYMVLLDLYCIFVLYLETFLIKIVTDYRQQYKKLHVTDIEYKIIT